MKSIRVEAPPPPPSGEFHILVGGVLLLLAVALHAQAARSMPLVLVFLFALILAGLATWQTTLLAEAEKVRPQLPPVRASKEGPFHFSVSGLLLAVVTLFFAAGFAVLPAADGYSQDGQSIQQSAVLTAFSFGAVALIIRGGYERHRGRWAEPIAAWLGALTLIALISLECTEPRWLTTAFSAMVLTGGILTHRRWLIWAHEVIALHQAATSDTAEEDAGATTLESPD